MVLDGEQGDENCHGKDSGKAVGMVPGTIMTDGDGTLAQGSKRSPPVQNQGGCSGFLFETSQGKDDREKGSGCKNSGKAAGMLPTTAIPTNSPPLLAQDDFIGFIRNDRGGFLFARSEGTGDTKPCSGGKNSDSALPRTVMLTNSPSLHHDDFIGFIHGGGGFQFARSQGTVGRTELQDTRTTIEDIWVENVNDAFDQIQMSIDSGGTHFVGLDTEFCRMDGVLDPRGTPTSQEMHYDQVCRIVNNGSLLQVGIVLADESFQSNPTRIFQFNLLFDKSTRSSDSESLRFVRDVAKLDLDQHANRGIPLPCFFDFMVASGLIGNKKLVWITYQGYCDFGYLIRGIKEVTVLPKKRTEFVHTVQLYFPQSYDLKILHELGICCKAPPPMPRPKGTGGFQAMANGLAVDRVGEATELALMVHLLQLCSHSSEIVCKPSTLPWVDSNATEVKVLSSSFDRESTIFIEQFSSRYPLVVSVDVLLVNSGQFSSSISSYARIRTAFSGAVEVAFAVSDLRGSLAYGRLWSFTVGKENDCIEPSQIARMLTEAEAVLNPNMLWCSSSSASFAYLVKVLSSSESLPPKLQGFLALAAAYFPNHRVLNMMLPDNKPTHRALMTLRYLQEEPRAGWVGFCDLTE